MVPPTIVTILSIFILAAGIGLGVWGLTRRSFVATGIAFMAAIVGAWSLFQVPPPRPEFQKLTDAPPGCALSAGFAICPPFRSEWEANQSFYGPAVGPLVYLKGTPVICFERACLQNDPRLTGKYVIQGLLLGEDYRTRKSLPPQPDGFKATSPFFASWYNELQRRIDAYDLLGGQLTGELTGVESGRQVVIFQRMVLSWPGGTTDTAQIQPLPLGAEYLGTGLWSPPETISPDLRALIALVALGFLIVIAYTQVRRPAMSGSF